MIANKNKWQNKILSTKQKCPQVIFLSFNPIWHCYVNLLRNMAELRLVMKDTT